MNWQKKIQQIIRTRDLRNRLLFVVFILVIFRLTAHIPLPGVDPTALKSFFSDNQFFSLLEEAELLEFAQEQRPEKIFSLLFSSTLFR